MVRMSSEKGYRISLKFLSEEEDDYFGSFSRVSRRAIMSFVDVLVIFSKFLRLEISIEMTSNFAFALF